MNFDSVIKQYGSTLTIKGTTDVDTFGLISATKLNDVQNRHNIYDLITLSDSAIESGDVIYDGSRYFIVVTTEDHPYMGSIAYRSRMLLLCNASLTIQRYVDNILTTIKTSIHCMITKSRLSALDDDRLIRDSLTGKQEINYIYLSAGEDLQGNDFIVDGTRTLKILNDISPYVTQGILEAQATLGES